MPFAIPSALRRHGVLAASVTAILLAVGGGTTAAFATTTDGTPTAPTTASASTCAPHLRALLSPAVSGQLKTDLKALRAEKPGDRADERALIRKHAVAGVYGPRAERIATIAAGGSAQGHRWTSTLPAELRADLKALRSIQPKSEARQAEARKIATTALDGGYGATVEQHAEAAQKRVQERCASQQ